MRVFHKKELIKFRLKKQEKAPRDRPRWTWCCQTLDSSSMVRRLRGVKEKTFAPLENSRGLKNTTKLSTFLPHNILLLLWREKKNTKNSGERGGRRT